MLEVNCTAKLRKLLRVDISLYSMVEAEATTLGVLYANISDVEYDPYSFGKAKESFLLMINRDSLLSFYVHIPEELPLEISNSELPGYAQSFF